MNIDAILGLLEQRTSYVKRTKHVSSFLLPNGVPVALDNRSGDVWLLEPLPAWIAPARVERPRRPPISTARGHDSATRREHPW